MEYEVVAEFPNGSFILESGDYFSEAPKDGKAEPDMYGYQIFTKDGKPLKVFYVHHYGETRKQVIKLLRRMIKDSDPDGSTFLKMKNYRQMYVSKGVHFL